MSWRSTAWNGRPEINKPRRRRADMSRKPPCYGETSSSPRKDFRFMASQNYSNHRQTVPIFHLVLLPVLLLTVVGALINLWKSLDDHERLYNASLIVVLSIAALAGMIIARLFALKAQDRAIRAEENLRHFAMTGKLLDPRLGIRQVAALRFAPDGEFPPLARRAAEENLAPDAIKRAIKEWRADQHRV